jgi:hypothetical protein
MVVKKSYMKELKEKWQVVPALIMGHSVLG